VVFAEAISYILVEFYGFSLRNSLMNSILLSIISIPVAARVPLLSDEVVTLVILLSIFLLIIGNIIHKGDQIAIDVSQTGIEDKELAE